MGIFYIKVKGRCRECKRDDVPHKAYGVCKNCYEKTYKRKYRKINAKKEVDELSTKSQPKRLTQKTQHGIVPVLE